MESSYTRYSVLIMSSSQDHAKFSPFRCPVKMLCHPQKSIPMLNSTAPPFFQYTNFCSFGHITHISMVQSQPVICDFSRGRHLTTDEWIHAFPSAPTAPYIYKRYNGTSMRIFATIRCGKCLNSSISLTFFKLLRCE